MTSLSCAGIYRIDGPNDCVYIGSAMNIQKRWWIHTSQLNNNKHGNIHLQRAWNKHGADAFEFSVTEICEKNRLLHYEQIWLDILFQSLDKDHIYNMCMRAGNTLGIKRSVEFCEANRKRMKNAPSPSEETRRKRSIAMKGRKFSAEHLRKRTESRMSKNPRSFVSPSGEIFVNVINLPELCRVYGLDKRHMYAVHLGKRNMHKGWRKFNKEV